MKVEEAALRNFTICYFTRNVIRAIKSRKMKEWGHAAATGAMKNTYTL
jgi:hypothetical protein